MRARALLLLLPLTAACSLLVNFVDAPDAGRDAAFDAPAEVDATDAGPDVSVYDASKLCKGLPDGWYCGYNGVNGTPPPEWLVHCVDASPMVRVCDAGCLAFPSGTPDECNECPGMPNGSYCGSQFATYTKYNAPWLMTCSQGMAVPQVDCTNGCQPGPGDASCK